METNLKAFIKILAEYNVVMNTEKTNVMVVLSSKQKVNINVERNRIEQVDFNEQ